MENSKVQSQRFSLNFPPIVDVAKRSTLYGATSLLMGRLNPVSITASVFNAIIVSFAKQSFEDASLQKKLIATVVSLAASALIVTAFGVPLLGRVGFAITKDFVIKLACFNALGEAVLFAIAWKTSGPKLPETVEELEKLSKDELLYIRNNFDQYKAMNVEVFAALTKALEKLELDTFTVFYIFNNYDVMTKGYEKVKDVKEIDLFRALHLRFYEQGLPFPNG